MIAILTRVMFYKVMNAIITSNNAGKTTPSCLDGSIASFGRPKCPKGHLKLKRVLGSQKHATFFLSTNFRLTLNPYSVKDDLEPKSDSSEGNLADSKRLMLKILVSWDAHLISEF